MMETKLWISLCAPLLLLLVNLGSALHDEHPVSTSSPPKSALADESPPQGPGSIQDPISTTISTMVKTKTRDDPNLESPSEAAVSEPNTNLTDQLTSQRPSAPAASHVPANPPPPTSTSTSPAHTARAAPAGKPTTTPPASTSHQAALPVSVTPSHQPSHPKTNSSTSAPASDLEEHETATAATSTASTVARSSSTSSPQPPMSSPQPPSSSLQPPSSSPRPPMSSPQPPSSSTQPPSSSTQPPSSSTQPPSSSRQPPSSSTQPPSSTLATPRHTDPDAATAGHTKPTPPPASAPTEPPEAHGNNPSQLNVGGDTTMVHESPTLDPLLAGLVSAFIITAVIITLLLFLKLRRRDNRPEFRRLQDLPMDDMMEDTPLSMYSY